VLLSAALLLAYVVALGAYPHDTFNSR